MYKEEDTKLISADSSSNKSEASLDSKLPGKVSINKFKPTDITIFIDKQDEIGPALHSNVVLASEEPNNRARLLFILTVLFIVILVGIVLISAIQQLSHDDHTDQSEESLVFDLMSNNHTVFNGANISTSTDLVPSTTVTKGVPETQERTNTQTQ
jgi:hypothetical protein